MVQYTVGQKTVPLYFCNNFVKMCYSEKIIGTYILQQIWNKYKTTLKSSLSREAYLYSAE